MKSKIIKQDIESIISDSEDYLYSLAGKKILITGGNGFIPSYIVDTITTFNKKLKDPCKLIILNKNPITKKSRLSHLLEDPNVRLIEQDVSKKFEVKGNPEIIIHAASRANPASFLESPLDTIDANVNGVRTLLDYAKENPVENFLFFSSSEVYGNPQKEFLPTPENFFGNVNCLDNMSCYSESKRFAETLCSTFSRNYGVPTKILRIFHTYGPGLRADGNTMAYFFIEGLQNKEIILKDSGKSKRSYSYISDTIKGIFKILFKGDIGEAYNVGSDLNNVSVKELAYLIKDILQNKSIVKNSEIEQNKNLGKIKDRMPDISKIRKLGYEPKIPLDEGLRRMKMHYDEGGIA